MTIFSFIFLAVVAIIPVVMVIYNAFFDGGSLDLATVKRVLFNVENYGALWNTIKIAFWVTLLGSAMGLFYAWLLGRSNIPAKGFMRALFNIPYMFPPFFGAMAWDLLLSGRGGYLNLSLIHI